MIARANTSFSLNAPPLAVLSDTEVLLVDVVQGKRTLRSMLVPPDSGELSGLLEFLWERGFRSVWIMPGTTVSRIATCAWLEQASQHWVAVTHADPREPTRPTCAFLWPKGNSQGEAHRLTFVFPEYMGWNWVLPDARSLLATVTYLEQVLARPLIESPNLIAHQFLTDFTRDQPPLWLRSSPTDMHTLHKRDETLMESGQELSWMRPLTLAELRQKYLHKYSHLSWQLEACLTVQLGGGILEHSSNGRAYNAIRPGIWRIHAERAGSIFDTKRLPGCLEGEWMSTPLVKCCQDISYHVNVREGYYWSQSHEVLKPWARALWQAAEQLYIHPQRYRHGQARANSFQTIKRLALMGMAILAQETDSGGWNRPDWWTQIVGRGRAILFTHLANLARKGVMPVLVDRDALWVISDDPNPLAVIPGLVSSQTWKGYRVGYDVPLSLSSEVKAAFRSAEHPAEVAMALDTLAGDVFPQSEE